MIETRYRIADRIVSVRQDWNEPVALFSGFEYDGERETEFWAELFWDAPPARQWYGVQYRRVEPDRRHFFASCQSPGTRLAADADWTHVAVEGCSGGTDGLMEVFLAAFYSFLARQGGVLAHASLVSHCGEAVMFTAASGVGKTTQARLWRQHLGAEILNGDKVILDNASNRCVAWGSPWRGSSPYARNECAPLKAVVVLEQAEENRIRRLGEADAMALFFPHVFYPSWDRACTEGVMAALAALLGSVPAYLLSCRPDREAVELTRCTIWGEIER